MIQIGQLEGSGQADLFDRHEQGRRRQESEAPGREAAPIPYPETSGIPCARIVSLCLLSLFLFPIYYSLRPASHSSSNTLLGTQEHFANRPPYTFVSPFIIANG